MIYFNELDIIIIIIIVALLTLCHYIIELRNGFIISCPYQITAIMMLYSDQWLFDCIIVNYTNIALSLLYYH